MKIIKPSVELIDSIDADAILAKLERCGRVSHLSESKGNPADFVRLLIKRGHESVLEHVSLTFHIICDRAIMSELTRHRHASFTVESTRYVEYNELQVIAPPPGLIALQIEKVYSALLNIGVKPEDARAVLPMCLKSELYMTANLRAWRHILKLRTDKSAHPQMRHIAGLILNIFKEKLPVIVEDLGDKNCPAQSAVFFSTKPENL